ncbi:MAG TPA: TraR/DksA C4-type zinc finger protein [Nitrospirales bacterium]|jgi:DnaK suppressor protein
MTSRSKDQVKPKKGIKAPVPKTASTRRQQSVKSSGKYKTVRQDLLNQRMALLRQAGISLPERQDQIISPDTTDQAQAEMDRNFLLRLKEREQKLIKKIDQAVQRIDNGTFGICRGCGNEIPLPRLKARPVTDLCIECKTKQEQDEIIRGTR